MTLNDLVCPYTVCDKNVAQDPSFKQGTIYVDIRGGSQERGLGTGEEGQLGRDEEGRREGPHGNF